MKSRKKTSLFGWFSEYKNVTWPTRERVLSSLWVVLMFVVIMSVFLGLIDFTLMHFFNWVFGLR